MALFDITDTTDKRLQVYSGMTDAQLRACATAKSGCIPELFAAFPQGLFIAESKNVIERALDNGYQLHSLFVEEGWFAHEQSLVGRVLKDCPEAPILKVTHQVFRQVTGYQVTRGALACFQRKPLPSVAELLKGARRVAVLEDITNYTNIGAIFRSAAALGVDAVLVSPGCHDPFYRRASRVSMGTVFQVPWTRIGTNADWVAEGMPLLRNQGFTTLALALREHSLALGDPALKRYGKLAMVMGTEGDGLRDSTIAACDHTVLIPMKHEVDSLNVAAASAVTFWELCKA